MKRPACTFEFPPSYLCNMGIRRLFQETFRRKSARAPYPGNLSVFRLPSIVGRGVGIREYNMCSDADKFLAMSVCTPLSTVIGKMGDMLSGAAVYVTDSKGNERRKYADIRNLLGNPNPMQTGASFLKSVEMSLKLYGYCPVYTLRAGVFEDSVPAAMYVIPAPLFHMVSTGKLFKQSGIDGIVEEAYIDWGGFRETLSRDDYFVIYDSNFRVEGKYCDIRFDSQSDSLSAPVNGWIAAMRTSCRIVTDGGPKGIVYYNGPTEMGNTMDPQEKDALERKLMEKYGMFNGFPIAASPVKVGWIPLDFDADRLKLAELDERCERKICGAFGINYSLFNDAKYDNQESAKKAAYQDVIIPDANKIAGALTAALCRDGAEVRLDFSHVECLSADTQKKAQALSTAASALSSMMSSGLIDLPEARAYLAGLMDIDPDRVPDIRDDADENDKDNDDGNEEEQV